MVGRTCATWQLLLLLLRLQLRDLLLWLQQRLLLRRVQWLQLSLRLLRLTSQAANGHHTHCVATACRPTQH